jgi:hypothetical protein
VSYSSQLAREKQEFESMGITPKKSFKSLSAGAFCLLAYPGIFSRLSNDGQQSPALFIPYSPTTAIRLRSYNCAGSGIDLSHHPTESR